MMKAGEFVLKLMSFLFKGPTVRTCGGAAAAPQIKYECKTRAK